MNQLFAISYNYTYSTPTTTTTTHNAGLFFALLAVGAVVGLIEIIALWKVFKKAGRPGWAAIIPIYNYWVLFEISGKPGWWALLALLSAIPFVGWIAFFVVYIIAMLELAKRFGKGGAFAIFGLVIFSFVGFLILGFGDATYQGAVAGGAAGGPANPPTPPVGPNPPQVSGPQAPAAPTPPPSA